MQNFFRIVAGLLKDARSFPIYHHPSFLVNLQNFSEWTEQTNKLYNTRNLKFESNLISVSNFFFYYCFLLNQVVSPELYPLEESFANICKYFMFLNFLMFQFCF